MSFFKKLTEELKELKANFEEKPKEEKKEESKPVAPSHEVTHDFDGHSQCSYQQPAYGQPPGQYGGQQQYPAPSHQHSSPPGQPLLPPGWMSQFDQNSQRWYYVEQATGRTQWDLPQQPQQQGNAPLPQQSGWPSPPPPSRFDYGSGPPSGERGLGDAGGFYNQYGGAQHAGPGQNDLQHQQNAQQYYGDADKGEKKDNDTRNLMLAAGAGLAAGGVAGAVMAHDSDSDSDDEKHSSSHAYAAAPPVDAAAPIVYGSDPYASPGYGADPYASQAHGYGDLAVPLAHDSDAESLHEAQKEYDEAVEAAADSDASSDELEDLQEAREKLEEERED